MPKKVALSASIAGLYVVLVLIFSPISFGPMQIRVAEALTLLPVLWAEAIPGLFIGCVISNFFGGLGIIDIVFGGGATLVSAILTRRMPNLALAALPPVVINGLVVGWYLSYLLSLPVILTVLCISIGEAIACFGLGIPLVLALRKSRL